MESRWSQILEGDRGWGATAFEGADQITPMRTKILRNKLIIPGLVCVSDGNVYIFHTALNIWLIYCSKTAVTFVNNIMGMESASVKYTDAFEPYAPILERDASDRIASEIPQSICIGTERLRISLIPGGLSLSRCESLIDSLPEEKKILKSLCYMPLNIRGWPKTWTKTSDYSMYKFLVPLFVDPDELKTVEWAIGNALIDPHSFSKTVILYGEGGHGKSTMINALTTTLMGCCGTIPDAALVGLGAGVPVHIAATVASNRIITAGDVGGPNRNTNLTVIKSLTGHDYMAIPPARVKTACTLFYGTNKLDDPIENEEWSTPAIMRRVVVVLMNAKIADDFSGKIPQDPISRLDFALRCVHTRLTNPYMPVSTMSVLLTIMGSRVSLVTKHIVPVYDGDIDDDEVIEANTVVAAAMSLSAETIGRLASRISKNAVRSVNGMDYIKGIGVVQ